MRLSRRYIKRKLRSINKKTLKSKEKHNMGDTKENRL